MHISVFTLPLDHILAIFVLNSLSLNAFVINKWFLRVTKEMSLAKNIVLHIKYKHSITVCQIKTDRVDPTEMTRGRVDSRAEMETGRVNPLPKGRTTNGRRMPVYTISSSMGISLISSNLISSHLISVPLPWRSSGHHSWRCNNTVPSFPVFRCPQRISKPHSRPFLGVTFPSLLLSSSPSCSFHCLLQNCLRHAKGSWDVAIPSEFPFLYHG